jgi:hypothetical protein
MGEDLPFDYGACDGLGHLMLLSGGMGGAPSVEGWSLEGGRSLSEGCGTLERGGDRLARGRSGPSSEAEVSLRAAGALERGGDWERG